MWLKHQPWVRSPSKKRDFRPDVEWNMWSKRDKPFNELCEGDEIVYVSGGGPAVGRLLMTASTECLVAAHYDNKEEAWSIIKAAVPSDILRANRIGRAAFINQGYTVAAPSSGWILAWTGTPKTWLDKPRPDGFRFRPNGWGYIPGHYRSW